MRVFWLTLLATGLLVVTIDTYEASQIDATAAPSTLMEDGTGYPAPSPTPVTK